MRIGVPKEVKNHEYRVAITPIGVHELVAHGHEVHVERQAGIGSQIEDDEYVAAGARIVSTPEEAWGTTGGLDMVLKVKEPVAEEYERMREGLVLFTYLHLAADKPLTEELVEEAGLDADAWAPLVTAYSSPGITSEAIHYFLARGLHVADRGDFVAAHEEADMETLWVPYAELLAACLDGRLHDAPVLVAVLTARQLGLVGTTTSGD